MDKREFTRKFITGTEQKKGGKNRNRLHQTPQGWTERQLSKFLRVQDVAHCQAAKLDDEYRQDALPLGALTFGAQGGKPRYLSYTSDDHMMTLAPSRAGKGTTQIIPTLLTYQGSCMVVDIKGENHAITGRYRSQIKKGATVHKFAPFDADTAQFNPLDFISGKTGDYASHPNAVSDCDFLAELMIPNQSAQESFWVTDARNLLSAILLHVKTHPDYADKCNMYEVYCIFAGVGDLDNEAVQTFKDQLSAIVEGGTENEDVAVLLSAFAGYEQKVLSSVVSTALSELKCWYSKPVRHATGKSTFSFMDLKTSMFEKNAPTTVYLVIPPTRMRAAKNLLRTIIGIGVHTMLREQRKPALPVLFLLDEFPALGYMPAILDGLAYIAGYGVQLWTFAQTIGQLKSIYGEAWQIFPASAGMFSAFNVNDVDTAEYLSRLLGKTEEYIEKYESSENVYEQEDKNRLAKAMAHEYKQTIHGPTGEVRGEPYLADDVEGAQRYLDENGYNHESGSRYGRYVTRPTIKERFRVDEIGPANQIRTIGNDLALVFLKGEKPALVRKMPYYQTAYFKGKFDKW